MSSSFFSTASVMYSVTTSVPPAAIVVPTGTRLVSLDSMIVSDRLLSEFSMVQVILKTASLSVLQTMLAPMVL